MPEKLPHLKAKKTGLRPDLNNRMAAYSAAAAVVFIGAPDAQAQSTPAADCTGTLVVHCDINPDHLLVEQDILVFDLDGDGTKDVVLVNYGTRGTYNSVVAYDCALYASLCNGPVHASKMQRRRRRDQAGPLERVGGDGGGVPNAFIGSSIVASALSSGASISPGGNFIPSNAYLGFSNTAGTNNGQFPGQGDRFLGLRFDIPDGSPHMGWIRVNMPGNGGQVFVQAYGYNTQPNQAVQAGQGPLPVELVSFNSEVSGSKVTLTWQTASETNNAGFQIESRTDEQPWRQIGFVNGRGSTTEAQSYSFNTGDLTPGSYQFRLKQTDYDGSFEISSVVEVVVDVPGTHVLLPAYPNPFNPSTRLTLVVAREQNVRLEVYDVTGRHVRTLHNGMLAENTQHQFRFEADDLPGGMYVIKAIGENFTETQHVTLVK
jgi:hypothetical protein